MVLGEMGEEQGRKEIMDKRAKRLEEVNKEREKKVHKKNRCIRWKGEESRKMGWKKILVK